jgi:hypothetical protein
LEKGRKDIISPFRFVSTLGGPRNQSGKHHNKCKRYDIVHFCCKKRVHKAIDYRNSRSLITQAGIIVSTSS